MQTDLLSDLRLPALCFAGHGCQAVELPYAGGRAVMDLVLPDAGTFHGFEQGLNWQVYQSIFASLKSTTIDLEMPKYSFCSAVDLREPLRAMGMTDALDPNLADFSGMTGARDLFISLVLHESHVAVHEQGTEAAAATSVAMAPTLAMQGEVQLRLDRTFVFAIRDLPTGQILFLGRVLDPTAH